MSKLNIINPFMGIIFHSNVKNDTIRSIKLETHETKDITDAHVNGSLTVIWRDWDKELEEKQKMVWCCKWINRN